MGSRKFGCGFPLSDGVGGRRAGKTRRGSDVDFETVEEVMGSITPVPGGVGPMNLACLLCTLMVAACRQSGVKNPRIENFSDMGRPGHDVDPQLTIVRCCRSSDTGWGRS